MLDEVKIFLSGSKDKFLSKCYVLLDKKSLSLKRYYRKMVLKVGSVKDVGNLDKIREKIKFLVLRKKNLVVFEVIKDDNFESECEYINEISGFECSNFYDNIFDKMMNIVLNNILFEVDSKF